MAHFESKEIILVSKLISRYFLLAEEILKIL